MNRGDDPVHISRREFGKKILIGSAGLGISLYLPGMLSRTRSESIVTLTRSEKLRRTNHRVDRKLAGDYLDQAMIRITGQKSAVGAWSSMFSPGERIGIKLSCLPGIPLSSSTGVVMAIADRLIASGIKPKHIYIWERTDRELQKAGFSISRSAINIFGTDHYRGSGYSRNIEISGSVGTCFSRIIETVDSLISVPVLKDHDIAGVSIGLKNFYGAIHNPNKFHGNRCDPYVADLCNHPFIRNKLRLTICDATRIQVHNGPAYYPRYAIEYGGLLVSDDPVALDTIGRHIIENYRKELNLKSLKEENREPTYIETAAKLKLGRADMKTIRTIEI